MNRLYLLNIYLVIGLLLLGMTFSSCDAEETIDVNMVKKELIAQKVQDRIEKFKESKLEKCMEKTLTKAESFVQEKLIEELKHLMNDTLEFPNKPIRPPMPENLYLDTIGVHKIRDFKLEK